MLLSLFTHGVAFVLGVLALSLLAFHHPDSPTPTTRRRHRQLFPQRPVSLPLKKDVRAPSKMKKKKGRKLSKVSFVPEPSTPEPVVVVVVEEEEEDSSSNESTSVPATPVDSDSPTIAFPPPELPLTRSQSNTSIRFADLPRPTRTEVPKGATVVLGKKSLGRAVASYFVQRNTTHRPSDSFKSSPSSSSSSSSLKSILLPPSPSPPLDPNPCVEHLFEFPALSTYKEEEGSPSVSEETVGWGFARAG